METGRKDKEFGAFLKWFINGGKETAVDGTISPLILSKVPLILPFWLEEYTSEKNLFYS